MTKEQKASVMDLFNSLMQYAKDKPTTPKQLKKNDPLVSFKEALDAHAEAFTNEKEIRAPWFKKTPAGLYLLSFGNSTVPLFGKKFLERATKEDALDTISIVRNAVEVEDKVKKIVEANHLAPKATRKPRTPK
ncbi:hypothetical protein DSM25559_1885 [Agrobacterium rosae]|uniref:Uncharacterized protein n=2 Tax=Agrobacterium rosae TaxID=1972867 RepID=A0A1R3TMS7_9HYPH|nr:hypothetical protein DSM25559_1885 [Agrobacterium rosae]